MGNNSQVSGIVGDGYCFHCGYALRGVMNPECPECGVAFDPADSTTYALSKTHYRADKLLRPHALFHLATIVAVLTLWYAVSAPGGFFIPMAFGMLAAVVLAVVWLLWLIIAILWYASRRARMRRVGTWFVFPAIACVGILMLALHAPLRLTFFLSRPAMDQLAAQAAATPAGTKAPVPSRVGLFPVADVQRFSNGMRFLVEGSGFIDRAGFAYSPNGPPPNIGGEDHYTHFSGPWYVWTESW